MRINTSNLYEQKQLPYPDLRGMDLRGNRGFAYLENMYVDYEGSGGAVESIVGYRKIRTLRDGIHSICIIGDSDAAQLVIHSGNKLYCMPVSERDKNLPLTVVATLENSDGVAMSLGTLCLISDGTRLISVAPSGKVSLISEDKSIVGCRCAAVYDGRLFLSGNPDCPGKVFYSSRIDEGEIGFTDSFTEGIGEMNILSLISLDGYLAVFNKNGMIFHKAAHSEVGDSYAVARIIDHLDILSRVVVFGHELLFMSPDGLMAIRTPTDDGEIRLDCRSAPINQLLLREELGNARFGVWMGYLVICFGERLYLADPRGEGGYDWYFISDVGGYKNDRRVYRYRKIANDGYDAHSRPDEAAEGEIYSRGVEGGGMIYYSVEGDKRYSVYQTAELCGGELLPVSELLCHGGLMWFATQNGGLYLFNNDKRGLMPENVPYAESCVTADAGLPEGAIHPIYYSFAGHAPRYAAITNPDESEHSGREVSSLDKTLHIGLKHLSHGKISVIDIADGKAIGERIVSADNQGCAVKSTTEADLHSNGLVTVSLPERVTTAEKKQLFIKADGFASPFGIGSIVYRRKPTDSKKERK